MPEFTDTEIKQAVSAGLADLPDGLDFEKMASAFKTYVATIKDKPPTYQPSLGKLIFYFDEITHTCAEKLYEKVEGQTVLGQDDYAPIQIEILTQLLDKASLSFMEQRTLKSLLAENKTAYAVYDQLGEVGLSTPDNLNAKDKEVNCDGRIGFNVASFGGALNYTLTYKTPWYQPVVNTFSAIGTGVLKALNFIVSIAFGDVGLFSKEKSKPVETSAESENVNRSEKAPQNPSAFAKPSANKPHPIKGHNTKSPLTKVPQPQSEKATKATKDEASKGGDESASPPVSPADSAQSLNSSATNRPVTNGRAAQNALKKRLKEKTKKEGNLGIPSKSGPGKSK